MLCGLSFLKVMQFWIMEATNEGGFSGGSTWLGEVQLSQQDMNRIVMDYLLIGYKEAAEKFREEAGVTDYSLEETEERIEERIRIKEAINQGLITEAVEMINSLHPELLDNDRYLHFLLLQQELIELIRNKDTELALTFAQERLAEKGEENPAILQELERTLALLVFEKPEKSPFGDLMQETHRQKVACEVNAALLKADNKQSVPRIERIVQMVLWSQDLLDRKGIKYPKMTDIGTGTVSEPKPRKSDFSLSVTR